MSTWKIVRLNFKYDEYDIIHCQICDTEERLSYSVGHQYPSPWFISTYEEFIEDVQNGQKICCPQCKEPVPEYIVSQMKLLL